jgi:hypothetical protein
MFYRLEQMLRATNQTLNDLGMEQRYGDLSQICSSTENGMLLWYIVLVDNSDIYV